MKEEKENLIQWGEDRAHLTCSSPLERRILPANFSCIIKHLTERRKLLSSGMEGDGGECVGN